MPGGDGRGPVMGIGRGGGARAGGPSQCICPSCGHVEKHIRGMPCAQKPCPKCGMKLVGAF